MKIQRAPDGKPVGFTDLPEELFPVQMSGIGPEGEVLWERTIHPYEIVDVPAAPTELQGKVSVHMTFADGTTVVQGPMSPEEAEAHIEKRIQESRDPVIRSNHRRAAWQQ